MQSFAKKLTLCRTISGPKDDETLVFLKSKDIIEPGIVYAPYIPIMVPAGIYEVAMEPVMPVDAASMRTKDGKALGNARAYSAALIYGHDEQADTYHVFRNQHGISDAMNRPLTPREFFSIGRAHGMVFAEDRPNTHVVDDS